MGNWFDDNRIQPYASPCDECKNSYYHFASCKFYNPRHDNELLTFVEHKTDYDFFVEEADERLPPIRLYAAPDG